MRRVVVFCVAAAMLATVVGSEAASLATYQLGPGPITFGMALPQGVATSGVQIGSVPTQTDVKTRWSDGSIRFAIVSAQVPVAGSYTISPAAAPSTMFTPAWPAISLDLVINNVTWTATPGAFTGSDVWLSGPVVSESRVVTRPSSGAGMHPLLEVVFDIRSYAAGAHRIDVTVQNVRDSTSMDKVAVSSVALRVNGAIVWSHGAVTSYAMTRWRHVQWVGGQEAAIVPDFEPTFLSGALPRILPTVSSHTYDLSGNNYDLMGGPAPGGYPAFAYGEMNPDMGAPGGRPEIGALDWWEAEYLAHKTANQRATVLRNADLTGAWSNHLSKPDGTMIKLGDLGYDPHQWWWDVRGTSGNRPLAPIVNNAFRGVREGLTSDTDTGAVGVSSHYDAEHVPAPMYVAYLISGDRFYVDQAKFWAASAVLHEPPFWTESDPVNFPGWRRGRNGDTGNERILDSTGMTREFAWPLRLVGITAWMVPDSDPDKSYFIETVQNNLNHVGAYLDTWVRLGYGGALGAIGGAETPSWGTSVNGAQTGRYSPQWRLNYTLYTVDWCTRQGLWNIGTSVDAFVNRVVNFNVQMNLQNPDFLNGKSGLSYNYYPIFNIMSNGVFTRWFDTFADVKLFNETYQYQDGVTGNPNWSPNQPATGYYNVEHHMALQIGIRKGLNGAQQAADRLAQVAGHLDDLNNRPGFAITFSPSTVLGTSADPEAVSSGPSAPQNVHIVK